MSTNEEDKKMSRMNVIYKALEDGWTVKKSPVDSRTFEFTKNQSMDFNYRGLIIFSTKPSICEDIQNHLENLRKSDRGHSAPPAKKRSISTPIIKFPNN